MKILLMSAIAISIIFTISLTTKIANADLAIPTDNGNVYNAANPGLNGINGNLQMCAMSINSCGHGSGSTCDINATCPDSPKKYGASS